MHVLMIPSGYPVPENPVYGSFFREQAQAIARSGTQIGVIYSHFRSLRQWPQRQQFQYQPYSYADAEGIPTYRYNGWTWVPKVPYLLHLARLYHGRKLFNAYVKDHGRPDLLHAQSTLFGGVLAAHLSAQTGIPFVITEHSSAYAMGRVRGWQVPLAQAALKAASARLVVSPSLGKKLEEVVGPVVQPWQWLPNILPADFAKAPVQPLPSTVAGKTGRFRFLCVAHLETLKGHHTLIQAFGEQFHANDGVELVLIGKGSQRHRLETIVQQLGLQAQIIFMGQVGRQQVLTEMQQADCVVLTSTYETFGVVLIEALACGRPVVATACGGPNHIVDAHNGILVPCEDVAQLGTALAQMVDRAATYDPALLKQRCLEQYGEAAFLEHLQKIYQAAIAA